MARGTYNRKAAGKGLQKIFMTKAMQYKLISKCFCGSLPVNKMVSDLKIFYLQDQYH